MFLKPVWKTNHFFVFGKRDTLKAWEDYRSFWPPLHKSIVNIFWKSHAFEAAPVPLLLTENDLFLQRNLGKNLSALLQTVIQNFSVSFLAKSLVHDRILLDGLNLVFGWRAKRIFKGF